MKTKMLVGFGLMMILLLGLVGCEGVSGPRGDAGNTGDPGQSWTAQSPDNRFFALAVCNGQMVNHSGAPKLYLAFDGEHQNAGDTIVSVRLAEGQVPNIDGVDEGSGGWGNQPTTVALEKVSGSDNLIASAAVRSAWDESYIYFQVKWTEVANEELGLVAAHSATPARWYVSQDLKTLANGYVRARGWTTVEPDDDYLLMMFETSGMQYFDHDGCFVTCHVGSGESNFHRTNQPRERMDTWIWSAALTQPTGYAADRYFDADTDPIVSLSWDLGTPVYTLNASFRDYDSSGTRVDVWQPIYQHPNDPNADAPVPFWDYEMVTAMPLDTLWTEASTIPYYYNSFPFGGTADVIAAGEFDESTGTWTVELRRARYTGSGDDAQF